MATRIKKYLDILMGRNLKRMREEQGWSQEKLAEMIDSDRRYISAMENGRGIGSCVFSRLCKALRVEESAFTRMELEDENMTYGKLTDVMRMLLRELQQLPEYELLRLLADLKEKKAVRTKLQVR